MNWNVFNVFILISSLVIITLALGKLRHCQSNRTCTYLRWFTIVSGLVIVEIILIDIRFTTKYPALFILYLPFHFLAPVLYSAFTFSYLNRMHIFRKYRHLILTPFIFFFFLYVFLKINLFIGYQFLSKTISDAIFHTWDENIAAVLSLVFAVWNYKSIRDYENSLGNLPYQIVIKKTKWLKGIYIALASLCIMWVCTIILIKIDDDIQGLDTYYPLWILFLAFYYSFYFLGMKHLKGVVQKREQDKSELEQVAHEFQISGLNTIFKGEELDTTFTNRHETTAILSYFATSLFDKNCKDDVLWDIAGNCMAKLNLEDCVIYLIDNENRVLLQKAAFGNKDQGEKRILSPMEIPIGNGIVGKVAASASPLKVDDTSTDERYILDDQNRLSELAVPILCDGKVIGVLDSEHSKKNYFQEKHLFLFQLISKLTATKLKHLSEKSQTVFTNDNAYYKELCRLMDEEKIFQNPDLSLTNVSSRLNISSTYLSQLVNNLSDKNFSDFINLYRIRDAEIKLTDSDFSRYTILAIGLEAGFNSKSAFYSAFKKHTGITPSVYRSNRLILS